MLPDPQLGSNYLLLVIENPTQVLFLDVSSFMLSFFIVPNMTQMLLFVGLSPFLLVGLNSTGIVQ